MKRKECVAMNRWVSTLFADSCDQRREISSVDIKFINPLVGYGIFATANIAALTYVGEYTGIVEKRNKRKNSCNDYIFGYVVCGDETSWVIDAEHQGNFTRFINHSYQPNLTSRWIIIDEVTRIILFSNRLIRLGEQLTYDYGPYYWKKRSFPQFFY